jgi:hypothetical protein
MMKSKAGQEAAENLVAKIEGERGATQGGDVEQSAAAYAAPVQS